MPTVKRLSFDPIGCLFLTIMSTQAFASSATLLPVSAPTTAAVHSGDEVEVWLWTMGPSAVVYERFGHNALRVRHRGMGIDVCFNWGLFDFEQPNFVGRFLLGRMLYSMAPIGTDATLRQYVEDDRTVVQQRLNLTADQTWRLWQDLLTNATPGNEQYRYDYYLDNCSTRVRDALDAPGVLNGAIRRHTQRYVPGRTLRYHTERLVSPDPLLHAGLAFGQGMRTDRPIPVWDELFVPTELQRWASSITNADRSGRVVPLAGKGEVLYRSTRYAEPMTPPNRTVPFGIVGLVTAGGIVLADRLGRWPAACAIGAYLLFGGIVGTIMLAAALFTDHWGATWNQNLLLWHPGLLVLLMGSAVWVVRSPRRIDGGSSPSGRWTRGLTVMTLWLSGTVLSLAALAVVLFVVGRFVPTLLQRNAAVLALTLPPHGAVGWVVWRRWRAAGTSGEAGEGVAEVIHQLKVNRVSGLRRTIASLGVALSWTAGSLSVGGCAPGTGGDGREVARGTGTVRPIEPTPPRQPMAIDLNLRESARQVLRDASSSPDPVLRGQAIEAAELADPVDPAGREETRRRVLTALEDRDEQVRFAAAMSAGTLGVVESLPTLRRLADDPSARVRIAARYALHRLGDPRLSRDLERYATDADPRVRGETAFALGRLGEPSAVRVLRPLRGDGNPLVRLLATEALWQYNDRAALEGLIAASMSEAPDDQMVALLALSEPRDPRVIDHVAGRLRADYPEVTLVAARALGRLGDDAGYGAAIARATARDPRLRALVAHALGDIARPDAQPTLARLLGDPDPYVRIAAAGALLRLPA